MSRPGARAEEKNCNRSGALASTRESWLRRAEGSAGRPLSVSSRSVCSVTTYCTAEEAEAAEAAAAAVPSVNSDVAPNEKTGTADVAGAAAARSVYAHSIATVGGGGASSSPGATAGCASPKLEKRLAEAAVRH